VGFRYRPSAAPSSRDIGTSRSRVPSESYRPRAVQQLDGGLVTLGDVHLVRQYITATLVLSTLKQGGLGLSNVVGLKYPWAEKYAAEPAEERS
jgi:hypothetical protein